MRFELYLIIIFKNINFNSSYSVILSKTCILYNIIAYFCVRLCGINTFLYCLYALVSRDMLIRATTVMFSLTLLLHVIHCFTVTPYRFLFAYFRLVIFFITVRFPSFRSFSRPPPFIFPRRLILHEPVPSPLAN